MHFALYTFIRVHFHASRSVMSTAMNANDTGRYIDIFLYYRTMSLLLSYSALSMYRGQFSLKNLRKTHQTSPARAMFGVLFVIRKSDSCFAIVTVLCVFVRYKTAIYRECIVTGRNQEDLACHTIFDVRKRPAKVRAIPMSKLRYYVKV